MIKGKVHVTPPEFCVWNMVVGDTGYVHVNELIITEEAIFLYLYASIIHEDDEEYDINDNTFFPIKRLGIGLTEVDFELDFSKSDYSNLVFCGKATYLNLMAEKHLYVIFSDYEIGQNLLEDLGNKDLEDQLEEALEQENYTKATEIRDKIAAKEKNNTFT